MLSLEKNAWNLISTPQKPSYSVNLHYFIELLFPGL